MSIRVECYAGYRSEQEPRAFLLGERRLQVASLLTIAIQRLVEARLPLKSGWPDERRALPSIAFCDKLPQCA